MIDKQLARFGKNLRTLRETADTSQEDLAANAKCHRNYVGLVERGERNPSLTKILAFSRALDCTSEELFAGLIPSSSRGGAK